MTTRLTSNDWGDICMIPTTIPLTELGDYFYKLCDLDEIKDEYNFASNRAYGQDVYGIPSTGNAQGIVYNKAVFEAAGITELPKTPDEFLADLQLIKDKTDAIPLYTNFAAGWTMTAWDAYISGGATGDSDWMNITMPQTKDPFADRGDGTGPYAVYKILYDAVSMGLTEEDPTTTDWEGCKPMINNGEIGCMVLGSWAIVQMQAAGDNADDIAYMPFPISVNGTQYASAGADYCFGVNKNISDDKREFVGLKNYIDVFTRDDCFSALKLSLYYMVCSVVQMALALLFATILSFKVKGSKFFRGALYFPCLICGISVGFIFKFFFTHGFVLDTLLGWLGIPLESLPYWLKDESINNIVLVACSVWKYIGQNIVMFIGAIASVDSTLYEAADIDGANAWHKFKDIILPSIRTIVVLNLIISVSGALSAFEMPYVVTGGAFGTSTYFVVMDKLAHTDQKVGLASAMAVVLLCLIMLVTAFQKFVQKKLEDAENKPVKLTVTTEQNYAAKATSATPAGK